MGEFEAIGPEAARAKVNVVVGPVNAALDKEQADCDKVDPGDAVNGVVERIEGVRAARARLTGQNQEISCRLGNRGETLRCSWAVDLDGTEVEQPSPTLRAQQPPTVQTGGLDRNTGLPHGRFESS